LQGDDLRGASYTVRLNIEKAAEISSLSRLKSLVCDRWDFIIDTLLEGVEKRSDVAKFGRFKD